MAKGRIRSRMELREQYEAAEAREKAGRQPGEEDEDVGDLEETTADAPATAEAEEAPAKAAKKKKKAVGEAKPRKKTVKAVRKRVVWVVFDNSSKKVAQFDYTKKAEADAYAEKMKTEKKTTYFVQPVKEDIQD